MSRQWGFQKVHKRAAWWAADENIEWYIIVSHCHTTWEWLLRQGFQTHQPAAGLFLALLAHTEIPFFLSELVLSKKPIFKEICSWLLWNLFSTTACCSSKHWQMCHRVQSQLRFDESLIGCFRHPFYVLSFPSQSWLWVGKDSIFLDNLVKNTQWHLPLGTIRFNLLSPSRFFFTCLDNFHCLTSIFLQKSDKCRVSCWV